MKEFIHFLYISRICIWTPCFDCIVWCK